MNHSDFVHEWKQGTLKVDVDRKLAVQVANQKRLPARFQRAYEFWNWVSFLAFPGAFVIWYFFTWWAGLLVFFVIAPALSKATNKSAAQFMIDGSIDDADFYNYVYSEGVIRLRSVAVA